MVNCTAAQHQGWSAEVYGDYMDGIESIVFNEGLRFEQGEFNKIEH
jgi:hypothetical protein